MGSLDLRSSAYSHHHSGVSLKQEDGFFSSSCGYDVCDIAENYIIQGTKVDVIFVSIAWTSRKK